MQFYILGVWNYKNTCKFHHRGYKSGTVRWISFHSEWGRSRVKRWLRQKIGTPGVVFAIVIHLIEVVMVVRLRSEIPARVLGNNPTRYIFGGKKLVTGSFTEDTEPGTLVSCATGLHKRATVPGPNMARNVTKLLIEIKRRHPAFPTCSAMIRRFRYLCDSMPVLFSIYVPCVLTFYHEMVKMTNLRFLLETL